MRLGQEREECAFVLTVSATQLGKHQRGQGVERIAGGHNSLVGKVAYSELPHRCGAGSGPAIDTSPELIVSDIEGCADKGARLTRRLAECDVLETALHLGPLAALRTIDTLEVVLERQVLER